MKKTEKIKSLVKLVRDQAESIRTMQCIVDGQVKQIGELKKRNEEIIDRLEKNAAEYHQNCYAMHEELQEMRRKVVSGFNTE